MAKTKKPAVGSAKQFARDTLDFIHQSPTAFHATATSAALLEKAGYRRLPESERWTLKPGGKYFVIRGGSALAAFVIGSGDVAANGFRLIAAHGDAPGFKIKPGGCLPAENGLARINTEVYGGPLLSTWFDRPLAFAGRAALRSGKGARPELRLVDLHMPLAVIPSVCIHFNRQANDGQPINRQTDTLPLLSLSQHADGMDAVLELTARELGVKRGRILDVELFAYEYARGELIGPDEDLVSASRLDNLAMVYPGLRGLIDSAATRATKFFVCFDHEEVGSRSPSGADGGFMPQLLERVCAGLNVDTEGMYRALANSLAVSADCAHAVHPNHPELHDPANRPALGGGLAIKYSAGQKYMTNAATAGMLIEACLAAGVPYQRYVNRSDIPGGSTIGPAFASATSIPTVDVGMAILAMHSVREVGSVADLRSAYQTFAAFYAL